MFIFLLDIIKYYYNVVNTYLIKKNTNIFNINYKHNYNKNLNKLSLLIKTLISTKQPVYKVYKINKNVNFLYIFEKYHFFLLLICIFFCLLFLYF